ncbi:flagellar protein FlbB [Bradyrhizobium sp.]|jgi:flagellar motility protein MotE (MotC chaperone)|uniref:MotE family protein n=1 Tax=Bradyrhizobium sp. TaxID=376 RepID=UPI002C127992|nr:flagellar protein FlbB [Bradyrhizobium sp.]HWX64138.1 flagellar protein FlbB [Bradyrhizobium sp.]
MKPLRDIRVIPVVVVAIAGLAVLKIAGLVLDGGYVFDYGARAAKKSWAQDNLNFPGGAKEEDVTGSVQGAAKEGKKEEKAEAPKPDAPETKAEADTPPPVSASERAILERLQARRQELDARAREIDIRESLLKAAEKRIEQQSMDIKATEARITAANGQKDEAESARLKNIITMYEAMKPKDAARVFDRLEMGVLIEIAVQIKPQKMSDIMGLMQPEVAERLTVEMARRAGADKSVAAPDLPKIEGKVVPTKPN